MKEYKDLVTLLKKVQATGGLDCDEASVCDYQDMIGHSSIEQLEELANGVYKESFYRVYGLAYGTVEAIKFFTKHGEKIIAMLTENAELKCDVEDLKTQSENRFHTAEKFRNSWEQEKQRADDLQKDLEAAQDEIIKLKARLFDLMEK